MEYANCAKLEQVLHKTFESNRLNVNREFFQIKKEQAIAILETFNEKEITNEVSDEMNNDINADDIASKSKVTKKRPPINFSQMCIPVSSILTYNAVSSVSVTVIADKKVEYLGEETSLTAVTSKLLNSKYAVQPIPRWSFNGTNLQEIYDATYSIED